MDMEWINNIIEQLQKQNPNQKFECSEKDKKPIIYGTLPEDLLVVPSYLATYNDCESYIMVDTTQSKKIEYIYDFCRFIPKRSISEIIRDIKFSLFLR